MIVRFAAVITFIALVAASAGAQIPQTPEGPTRDAGPAATYMPVPPPAQIPTSPQTPTPQVTSLQPAGQTSTPQPKPPANLLTYTGQLLDMRNNYVYFTTGDAFPAIDPLRIVSYETNQPTSVQPAAKMFARATFDPASHKIVELAITTKRLQITQDTTALIGYAVEKSNPDTAPELHTGQAMTGRQVAVVFEVTAPPTTALTDNLYISTDASGWNPQAIKLDRVDAYKYRAQRYFASGTKFAYRVTRGTWNSVERGEDNLDPAPHQFLVREVDSLAARVTVYHWSDENPSAPQAGPNAIPTPYNSNPFGGGPGGISVPQLPTPQPTPHR
jgi:hypothetical protein